MSCWPPGGFYPEFPEPGGRKAWGMRKTAGEKKQTTIASFDKILLQRSQGSETGLSL